MFASPPHPGTNIGASGMPSSAGSASGSAFGSTPFGMAPRNPFADGGGGGSGMDADEEMATAMDALDIDEPLIASSEYAPSSAGPVLMNPAEGAQGPPRRMLDLVFIQDATGSQGSYINHATDNIEEICNTIINSGKLAHPSDLRFGLIAYRDHPPQDHTFVTKTFPFTSDVAEMKANLKSLYASGGGDGPEAVTAAMYEALYGLEWRKDARKMIVLISDAPPHGLGEYGDGFDAGSPDGHDPVQLVRQMASRGITLFFIACEPALSGYLYANEFYHAMTSLTGGVVLPLTTSSLLSHAIIGSVLENLDMEDLIREVGDHVAERVLGGQETVEDITRRLHEHLMLRNASASKLKIESIYRTSDESAHNLNVWENASDIKSARPLLKKVIGTRFTEKYQASKYSTTRGGSYSYSASLPSYSPYTPPLPPRTGAPSSSSTTISPSSFPRITPPTSPSSASTHKIAEFAAFEAPKTRFSPGGPDAGRRASAGFGGGYRGGMGMNDDDDEDEDEGRANQGIGFSEDSISYDQVKRIVMASAFRGMRA